MQRLFWLVGNAMAGFTDLCVGALIATLIAQWYGVELTLPFILFGAVMAVLPDFDIIPGILMGKVEGNHHTTLFHRPVLVLPVVMVVADYMLGGVWTMIAFLAVFYHFLHDTLGSGIPWTWPVHHRLLNIHGWAPCHHDAQHAQWVENRWLTPNIPALAEWMVGSVALLCVVFAYMPGVSTPAVWVVVWFPLIVWIAYPYWRFQAPQKTAPE